MHRLPARAAGLAAVVLVLAACTPPPPSPEPSSSPAPSSETPVPTPTPTPAPITTPSAPMAAPTPSSTLTPGAACDPADGFPDCTDATGAHDGRFVYLEGYAQCVADFGSDEAYGLCTDLDGDGRAGYPDSG